MSKRVRFICFAVIMLSLTLTVYAGDVPESLLYEDGAQIFFAEVVHDHPDKENPDIEFSPIKKIKGDVKIGTKQIAYRPNPIGDFTIQVGDVYLFTYFDENNPTDIFETTTQDTATLKLKNVTGDMWERFEEYLNEGQYEEAELKRVGKLSNAEKIQNAKVLSDMFVFDEKDIETMEVVYPGDGNSYGCYIDKSQFFDIAETISLVPKRRIDPVEHNGVFIVAVDKHNERTAVLLTDKGRVGCTQYEPSSAVTTQYDISRADYLKLYAFLPDEATAHIPLENPMNKYLVVFMAVVALVFVAAFAVGVSVKKKKAGN